jgi:hypothetical protein
MLIWLVFFNGIYVFVFTHSILKLDQTNKKKLQVDLAANLFYSWLCFNTVTNTARNGGYATKQIYFVDESHLPASEEAIEWLHQTCTEIRDPFVPSR